METVLYSDIDELMLLEVFASEVQTLSNNFS